VPVTTFTLNDTRRSGTCIVEKGAYQIIGNKWLDQKYRTVLSHGTRETTFITTDSQVVGTFLSQLLHVKNNALSVPVGPDASTCGQLHGLYEYRHILAAA